MRVHVRVKRYDELAGEIFNPHALNVVATNALLNVIAMLGMSRARVTCIECPDAPQMLPKNS